MITAVKKVVFGNPYNINYKQQLYGWLLVTQIGLAWPQSPLSEIEGNPGVGLIVYPLFSMHLNLYENYWV